MKNWERKKVYPFDSYLYWILILILILEENLWNEFIWIYRANTIYLIFIRIFESIEK